jgi:hypothetical protein
MRTCGASRDLHSGEHVPGNAPATAILGQLVLGGRLVSKWFLLLFLAAPLVFSIHHLYII